MSANPNPAFAPDLEVVPLSENAAAKRLKEMRRHSQCGLDHTVDASCTLLTQGTSLDKIPEHDELADAHVAAIRDLARRLPHIKTVGEAIEIAYSIERHCDGYDDADGREDAEVQTVTVCNVNARASVRAASAELDAVLTRAPRRQKGGRR